MKVVDNDTSKKLNGLLHGMSGSGKTHLALTAPDPVLVNVGETETTARINFPNVPIITVEDAERDMLMLLDEPEYTFDQTFRALPRWSNYKPLTIVVDSATMLSINMLGRPNIKDPVTKKILSKGSGIMAIDRNRNDNKPSIEDYGILYFNMVGIFNGLRALNDRYHTIITAHSEVAEIEEDASRTLQEKSKNPSRQIGLPVLPGKLRWHADNMCDFFLYCEAKQVGGKYRFYAHTIANGIWKARTKLYGIIENTIEDPTFDKIYPVYLEALKGK